MSHNNFIKGIKLYLSLIALLLLSACQSNSLVQNYTEEHRHSGFLSDYSKLEQSIGLDEEPVLRWISPELSKTKFNNLMINSVVLKPENIQTEEISTETLLKIQQYFDLQLKNALSSKYTLTDKPSDDTAEIKLAITGVQLESEGMKVTEVLPYGAVIGLIRKATDTRNREVTVLLEMEIINNRTQQPILQLLRVGEGENVRMFWGPNFELEHVKQLLDDWVSLAATNFQQLMSKP
jgi:hypothetical protein